MVEGVFYGLVIKEGVINNLYFAWDVFNYLIVPSCIGVTRSYIPLGYPEIHETTPFCDKGRERLRFFI